MLSSVSEKITTFIYIYTLLYTMAKQKNTQKQDAQPTTEKSEYDQMSYDDVCKQLRIAKQRAEASEYRAETAEATLARKSIKASDRISEVFTTKDKREFIKTSNLSETKKFLEENNPAVLKAMLTDSEKESFTSKEFHRALSKALIKNYTA